MIQKLQRILQVVKRSSLQFRIPKHRRVALFHHDGFDAISTYIDTDEITVIDPSVLNFWILLRCLVTGKPNLVGYANSYIKTTRPIVVFTFIDNDPIFYLLKSRFPSAKYIAIQNGLRHNYSYEYRNLFIDIFSSRARTQNLTADLICTFGTASSAMFEKYIHSPTLVIGNIKNNLADFDTSSIEEFDIMFMSQLAPFDFSKSDKQIYLNEASSSIQNFYSIEARVASFLAEYCNRNSLKFAISGKRGSDSYYESDFFKNAIGPIPYTFLPREENFSSYINAYKARLVVVVDSTIGYELMSRGKKVAFLSARSIGDNIISRDDRDTCFGYPNTYPDKGPFWTNIADDTEFERVVNTVQGLSQVEWASMISPYTDVLMAYQPGNSAFIQLLQEEGIPVRNEVLHRA